MGIFAQQALSENWQGVTWIDSETHLKILLQLGMCLQTVDELDHYFSELYLRYDAIEDYILYKTGQEPESEPELEEIFRRRVMGQATKAELALKNVAIEVTRANMLYRKDLKCFSGSEHAA
ncbi:MAG: hypothetical protein EB017_14905 [Betaproteobacteria bacterium]|nr:hypothetical protein [Betaproteobacteria bacterium]